MFSKEVSMKAWSLSVASLGVEKWLMLHKHRQAVIGAPWLLRGRAGKAVVTRVVIDSSGRVVAVH
jgi:hypothetical protein